MDYLQSIEILKDFKSNRISRKEFISRLGLFMAGFVLMDTTSQLIGKFLNQENIVKAESEYHIELIDKLFKNYRENCKYIPGTSHRIYKGMIHPDDKFAVKSLEKIGIDGINNLELFPELILTPNIDGNLVTLGSPSTNALTAITFQYRYHNLGVNYGFIRERETQFELPFEYFMDGKYLIDNGAIYKRKINDELEIGPNWGIKNNSTNNLILPKVNNAGFIKTDYLLITVLPNIYEKKELDTNSKIIILGGAHGTGTKAIDLLFRNKNVLTQLINKTENIQYWQALIEINEIAYNERTLESIPYDISNQIIIKPINIYNSKLV